MGIKKEAGLSKSLTWLDGSRIRVSPYYLWNSAPPKLDYHEDERCVCVRFVRHPSNLVMYDLPCTEYRYYACELPGKRQQRKIFMIVTIYL